MYPFCSRGVEGEADHTADNRQCFCLGCPGHVWEIIVKRAGAPIFGIETYYIIHLDDEADPVMNGMDRNIQGRDLGENHFPQHGAGVIRRNWRVLLRVFFALVWSLDAYFKWLYVYYGGSLLDTISSSAQGQPEFAKGWIDFWAGISASTPNFTLLIAILETL